MNATKFKEPSYCVADIETLELGRKIRAWIAARESEGWTVEFKIRADSDLLGVIWQCTKNNHGTYHEFTPCISMSGTESYRN